METTGSGPAPRWCVYGCHSAGPWVCFADDLSDRHAALGWLRRNHADFPEYPKWYVDREDGEGSEDAHFGRHPDGSLFTLRGAAPVFFYD